MAMNRDMKSLKTPAAWEIVHLSRAPMCLDASAKRYVVAEQPVTPMRLHLAAKKTCRESTYFGFPGVHDSTMGIKGGEKGRGYQVRIPVT